MPTATDQAIAEIRACKPLAKHVTELLELVRPHIVARKFDAIEVHCGSTI